MYKKILVPLDGSELGEQVIPHVTRLAGCTGAEIILLRIPTEVFVELVNLDPEIIEELRRSAEAEAHEYLDTVRRRLESQQVAARAMVVRGAPVWSTILDVAREQAVDLIAMSTHGRSGLARMLLGSVADQVIRHSPVPVLLVRPASHHVPRSHEESAPTHNAN